VVLCPGAYAGGTGCGAADRPGPEEEARFQVLESYRAARESALGWTSAPIKCQPGAVFRRQLISWFDLAWSQSPRH
jgi:hypothetical protein